MRWIVGGAAGAGNLDLQDRRRLAGSAA